MNKMVKISDRLYKLLQFLFTALCVFGIFTVLASLTILFKSGNRLSSATLFIEQGIFRFTMSDKFSINTANFKSVFFVNFLTALVGIVYYAYVIKLFSKILDKIRNEQPFDKIVYTNIKKIGISYMVMNVIIRILTTVYLNMSLANYDVNTIFRNDYIAKVEINQTIDLNFLFIGAGLVLISYIFKYGAELQTQVDETL